MKKLLLILASALTLSFFAGCGAKEEPATTADVEKAAADAEAETGDLQAEAEKLAKEAEEEGKKALDSLGKD